jgi:hypothetical protein
MNDSQDLNLFAEIPNDEETLLSGGYDCRGRSSRWGAQAGDMSGFSSPTHSSSGRRFSFDLNFYIFGIGAAYLFGNPGVTKEEVQFVWERSFRFW